MTTSLGITPFNEQVFMLVNLPKHVREVQEPAVEIAAKLNDVTKLNKFIWQFSKTINDSSIQPMTNGGDPRLSSMQAVHGRIVNDYLPYYFNSLYANASNLYFALSQLVRNCGEYIATKSSIERQLFHAGANSITRRYYLDDSKELASIEFSYFTNIQRLDDAFRDRVSLSIQVAQVLDEVIKLQADIVEEMVRTGAIKTDLVAPDNVRFTKIIGDQADFMKDMVKNRVEFEKNALRLHQTMKTKLSEFTQAFELEPKYDFKGMAKSPHKAYANLYKQVDIAIERTMTTLQRELQSLEKIKNGRLESRQYLNLHPNILGLQGRKAALVYSIANSDLNMKLAARELEQCIASKKDSFENCAAELSGTKTKDAKKIKGYINWVEYKQQITGDLGKYNELYKKLLDAQKDAMDAATAQRIMAERDRLVHWAPEMPTPREQVQMRDRLDALYKRVPSTFGDLKDNLRAQDAIFMGEQVGRFSNAATLAAANNVGRPGQSAIDALEADLARLDSLKEVDPARVKLAGGGNDDLATSMVVGECGNDMEVYNQIEKRIGDYIASKRTASMSVEEIQKLDVIRQYLINNAMKKYAPALSPILISLNFLRSQAKVGEGRFVGLAKIVIKTLTWFDCFLDCMLSLGYDYIRRSYAIGVASKHGVGAPGIVDKIKADGTKLTNELTAIAKERLSMTLPLNYPIDVERYMLAYIDLLPTQFDINIASQLMTIGTALGNNTILDNARIVKDAKEASYKIPAPPKSEPHEKFGKDIVDLLGKALPIVESCVRLYGEARKTNGSEVEKVADFWAGILSCFDRSLASFTSFAGDSELPSPTDDATCMTLRPLIAVLNERAAEQWGFVDRYSKVVDDETKKMKSLIESLKLGPRVPEGNVAAVVAKIGEFRDAVAFGLAIPGLQKNMEGLAKVVAKQMLEKAPDDATKQKAIKSLLLTSDMSPAK